MDHNRTLRDVIIKSSEAESSTARTIRQQFDRKFLASQGLPELPKFRAPLLIRQIKLLKNMSKKIPNEAHNRMTNGGFARTAYGGFYMQ